MISRKFIEWFRIHKISFKYPHLNQITLSRKIWEFKEDVSIEFDISKQNSAKNHGKKMPSVSGGKTHNWETLTPKFNLLLKL